MIKRYLLLLSDFSRERKSNQQHRFPPRFWHAFHKKVFLPFVRVLRGIQVFFSNSETNLTPMVFSIRCRRCLAVYLYPGRAMLHVLLRMEREKKRKKGERESIAMIYSILYGLSTSFPPPPLFEREGKEEGSVPLLQVPTPKNKSQRCDLLKNVFF